MKRFFKGINFEFAHGRLVKRKEKNKVARKWFCFPCCTKRVRPKQKITSYMTIQAQPNFNKLNNLKFTTDCFLKKLCLQGPRELWLSLSILPILEEKRQKFRVDRRKESRDTIFFTQEVGYGQKVPFLSAKPKGWCLPLSTKDTDGVVTLPANIPNNIAVTPRPSKVSLWQHKNEKWINNDAIYLLLSGYSYLYENL